MRKYPLKSPKKKILIERIEAQREIIRSEATYPFQMDYSDNIVSILDECSVDDNCQQYSTPVHGHYSAKACTISSPKLTVHLFQRVLDIPFHGSGDFAVLEAKKTRAYVALYGESQKQWLDRGVVGYSLPLKNPIKEVRGIVALWTEFMQEITLRHPKSDAERYWKIKEDLAQHMSPMKTQLKPIINKYIVPIFGKDAVKIKEDQKLTL